MTLADIQDLFTAITIGEPVDAAVREACLAGDAELSAAERAGIYSGIYRCRLIDALKEDYPLLARLLGDDEFFALAAAYVGAHPSSNPSLALLGRELPGFLRASSPSPSGLADLAELEWARAEALIAPDARPAGIDALGPLGEALAAARLELVPSMRLLSLRHDGAALWGDLEAGRETSAAAGRPASLLVWRKGFEVFHARVSPQELAALAAVRRGATLGEAFEAFAAASDPVGAALEALSSWFAEGLVARVLT